MTAYYNEIDPFAAAWLRQLIKHGHIAPGDVDERSITDVRAHDLAGYRQVHFFAGIGGWSLAARLAGIPDDYPLWTGSAPCQPFSSAGKQRGTDDERHLWPAMLNLIAERRPTVVAGEQVASRLGLDWLASVRADLEGEGYAVGAADLCAASVGAPHIRQRLYWGGVRVADGNSAGPQGWTLGRLGTGERLVGSPGMVRQGRGAHDCGWRDPDWLFCRDERWRPVESGTFPLADGVPARVGRLRGYGNAIVPQVAAAFLTALVGGAA